MATARLIPSASSAASGVTISSASNMYANIDSTTTAELTSTSKDTTARYAYIRGFNFIIPSDAIVTAFEVKIKGYESRLDTSSSYAPCLVNNTSAISGTTASDGFHSSDSTVTIPTGSLTWSQITGYGSDFGIRVTIRRSNKNQQGYLYIYGAEIDVTYSTASEPPTITVGTPSRSIISDETGYDQCVCTFTSDMALQAWEARATKSGTTPARGVGLLVESGTTLAAGASGTVYVENEELTNGDGEYTITVYGQSTGGVWSE